MTRNKTTIASLLIGVSCLLAQGCALVKHPPAKAYMETRKSFPPAPHHGMPREQNKVVLPTYTIEPPDILTIDIVHLAPKQPYALRPQDVVAVEATGVFEEYPLKASFVIMPDGSVDLGAQYGRVQVAGLMVDQARQRIHEMLAQRFRVPQVWVSLVEARQLQPIQGEHLVGPDGTVNLGVYGSVRVVGLSLAQAKQAIESHLQHFLQAPEVAVDVFAYNSKVYYVITEGAGLGDSVQRFPVTGNETVLDALSNIGGTTQLSSHKMWIARPHPGTCKFQTLPVHWRAVTAMGESATNYQILPGDRVFIAENRFVAWDTAVGKLTAPFERMMGFTILGTRTAGTLSGDVLGNAGNQGGFGP